MTFRISDGDGHKRSPLGSHRQHDPAGEEVLTQAQATTKYGWVEPAVLPGPAIFGADTLCCFDFTDDAQTTYRSSNIIQTIDSHDGNAVQFTSSNVSQPQYATVHDGIPMMMGAEGIRATVPGPAALGKTASDPITYLFVVRLAADDTGYLLDTPGSVGTNRTIINTSAGDLLSFYLHGAARDQAPDVLDPNSYYGVAVQGSSVDNRRMFYRKLGGGLTQVVDPGSPAGSGPASLLYLFSRQPGSSFPFTGLGALAFAMYDGLIAQSQIDAVFDHYDALVP